ncbi:anosmin-1 [Trichomycterus rosablanca]|uniref:anosmin-1 n=1 Tax=Trichomycterus rosablanca TaxID=2290929 RepID=UPI002F35C3A3
MCVMRINVWFHIIIMINIMMVLPVSLRRLDEAFFLQSVSRARCSSRCLSLHLTRPSSSKRSQCLEPCKASWDLRENKCQDLCKTLYPNKHAECSVSCEFFLSADTVKQGTCPAPDRASGFAAACVNSCESDAHCSLNNKCCSNGCGRTCQTPRNVYKGVPLKPRSDLMFVEFPPRQLEIRWSSKFNISLEPVVYVVQQRWNYGIHPSEDDATPWQDVAQVTEERVQLVGIRPGRWYQFRVAAVNIHGTRGFTAPSKHFRSSTDPSPPPRPSGLKVSNMTTDPDGLVTARLDWTLPEEPDVPVHHYKIIWSWNGPARSVPTLQKKRRKSVEGVRNWVDLEGLMVNSTYTVELQAISYWGQTRLKSSKTSLQFNTTHPNLMRFRKKEEVSVPEKKPNSLVEVGTPYYLDGRLHVHVTWTEAKDMASRYYVQWSPEHCNHNQTKTPEKSTTQEKHINLAVLLFSCRYRLMVHQVKAKKHSEVGTTTFITPSCSSVHSTSHRSSGVCPPHTGALKVLSKVENLTASFSATARNITGKFSWLISQHHQPIIGFQVTWADITASNQQINLPNSIISQSQILPPNHNFLTLRNLRSSSWYRVEVKVITTHGEGPAAIKMFLTPGDTSSIQHRPKLHHQHPEHQRHSAEHH